MEDDPEWLADKDLEGSYRVVFEISGLDICLKRVWKTTESLKTVWRYCNKVAVLILM
jgi:hypothetical protein